MPAATPPSRRSRRLTVAGLIAISAATLLMMAWAIFPTSAFATVPWDGNGVTNGQFNNTDCNVDPTPHIFWIFTGTPGPGLTDVTLTVNGQTFDMDQAGGPNSAWQGTTPFFNLNAIVASVDGATGSGVLTISHGCPGEITTTTTTTPVTTTTTTPVTTTTTTPVTTTTTTPVTTTTTTPVTTTTTTPVTTTTTTTTTPGGGGGGGPTTTVAPTSSPTIAPTTVHPSKTKTATVAPTTVRPGGGGTAFTGFEDVVPLGLVALTLMTGGSGLLWAGTRRRRNLDDGDE